MEGSGDLPEFLCALSLQRTPFPSPPPHTAHTGQVGRKRGDPFPGVLGVEKGVRSGDSPWSQGECGKGLGGTESDRELY